MGTKSPPAPAVQWPEDIHTSQIWIGNGGNDRFEVAALHSHEAGRIVIEARAITGQQLGPGLLFGLEHFREQAAPTYRDAKPQIPGQPGKEYRITGLCPKDDERKTT